MSLINVSTASARRGFALAAGLFMLAACGGGASQNNGAAAAAAPAAPAAPAVPADAGPVRAALAEFDGVCGRVMDRNGYIAAAGPAGWERFEPAPDSQLARILAFGEQAARELLAQAGRNGEVRGEYAAFRKTTNGRELLLLVSQVHITGMTAGLECRLYDFTAPPPTDADIAAWTNAPPQKSNEDGATGYLWNPSFRPGFTNIDVVHLSESSPLRAQIPMSGLSITALQGPRPNQP